ncbi:hypothetical protein [Phenylobacterium sp.]|uniref:hypothetical protein n=1 Tax=Phenylobacterium sp. TaxID=1871053 RepID=UPI002DE300BA|nr:hypothetical protein [Phenylobacterium sp.]
MRLLMALAALLTTVLAAPVLAQPAAPTQAPAIREFDIATIERLGRTIYRQDSAAWRATDALQAQLKDIHGAGVKGWIVEGEGDVQRVRFLRDVGHGLEAGYDVEVGPKGETRVSEPAERSLAPEERAAFAARQTAVAHLTQVCRAGYNSVVLKDPGGDGWLVWLLAPMVKAGEVPIGGHYRFTISADGATVVRMDALSRSCLVMTAPAPASGIKPVAIFVTHVVSPTPVETHVFLQMQAGQPMYVMAGGQVWKIDGGHIAPPRPLDGKP